MSAKFSTNKEKPYLACAICNVKYIGTTNEWVLHVIDEHGDDLNQRAPKVCRDFIKICRTFFEESD